MILLIGKDPVIFFSKKLRILIHLNLFINVILHFSKNGVIYQEIILEKIRWYF